MGVRACEGAVQKLGHKKLVFPSVYYFPGWSGLPGRRGLQGREKGYPGGGAPRTPPSLTQGDTRPVPCPTQPITFSQPPLGAPPIPAASRGAGSGHYKAWWGNVS